MHVETMQTAKKVIARPKVTVGLAVYNGERLLSNAIQSWLGQDWDDFELIISDNGSTDNTESICHEYCQKDARLKYYRYRSNMGQARSFGRLMEMARGDYFILAFHNDFFDRKYLKRCLEVLENDPSVVLCYAGTHLVDDNGTSVADVTDRFRLDQDDVFERYFQLLSKLDLCNCFHGVARTDAVQVVLPLDCSQGGDVAFLGKLILKGKFYQINEPLCFRRVPGHWGSVKPIDRHLYLDALAAPYLPCLDLPPLPFVELIKILADYICFSETSDVVKERLLKTTYEVILTRYKQQILSEVAEFIDYLKKGYLRHFWKNNNFNKAVSNEYRYMKTTYALKRLKDIDMLGNIITNNADFQYVWGLILCYLGRLRDAKIRLESALKIDPHHSDSTKLLTSILTVIERSNPQ